MEKLLKFLSLILTLLILPPAPVLAIPSFKDLEQFENPEFVRTYAGQFCEEYTAQKKSESHKNPYWSWGIKMSLKVLIDKLIKKNPMSAVRLTLTLIVFLDIGRKVNEYNPRKYDQKCCIICAPDIKFHDTPLIVQLFANNQCSERLCIE